MKHRALIALSVATLTLGPVRTPVSAHESQPEDGLGHHSRGHVIILAFSDVEREAQADGRAMGVEHATR